MLHPWRHTEKPQPTSSAEEVETSEYYFLLVTHRKLWYACWMYKQGQTKAYGTGHLENAGELECLLPALEQQK